MNASINIYLDTNIIFNDFLLNGNMIRLLLRLSKYNYINLFINKVVYQESLNKYKQCISKKIDEYKNAGKYLSKYSGQKVVANCPDIKDFIDTFKNRYKELQENYGLKIIDYDNSNVVLDRVFIDDMNGNAPFFNKSKKQIRDAIIWYMYYYEAIKHPNSLNIFITNNLKDFIEEQEAKNKDKKGSFKPHPNIVTEDVEFLLYTSINSLIQESEEIKELLDDLQAEEEYDEMIDIAESISDEYILSFLSNDESLSIINDEVENFINELDPSDINEDLFMGGYVSPGWDVEPVRISNTEFEILDHNILFTGQLYVVKSIEINLYNPAHDSRDDKYSYFCETDLEFELLFSLIVDRQRNLKNLEINEIHIVSGGEELGKKYFGYDE